MCPLHAPYVLLIRLLHATGNLLKRGGVEGEYHISTKDVQDANEMRLKNTANLTDSVPFFKKMPSLLRISDFFCIFAHSLRAGSKNKDIWQTNCIWQTN